MKTNFVSEVAQDATLSQAILLWKYKGGAAAHVALHDIKNGAISSKSRELTVRDLREFNRDLQDIAENTAKQTAVDILPEHVLYSDPISSMTVWWRPSTPTPQFFNCAELGKTQGVCAMPSLVFKQIGTDMSMCAIQGKQRPTSDTPIFHAPLFNTYSDTRVCLGQVKIEEISEYKLIQRNEKSLLCGVNTHPNGQHAKCKYPNGLFAMWRDLLADASIVWDDAWLSPIDMTLGEWIKEG